MLLLFTSQDAICQPQTRISSVHIRHSPLYVYGGEEKEIYEAIITQKTIILFTYSRE